MWDACRLTSQMREGAGKVQFKGTVCHILKGFVAMKHNEKASFFGLTKVGQKLK